MQTVQKSKWSERFLWAAVVQGLIVTIVAGLVALPVLTPSPSRIIAAGGAGTWFYVGFSSYLMVGVLGVAVTSLFYHHIESVVGRPYRGVSSILAWIHLIFMNVGAFATGALLMMAGYSGGAAALPASVGGKGLEPGQVHGVIAWFPQPISVAIGILAVGVLVGGIGHLMASRSRAT